MLYSPWVKGERRMSFSEIPTADIQEFLRCKREPLERFLDVLLPLCELFKIPAQALHVFYMDRDLMSFNSNKSIFVNLRCFEARHDREGSVKTAYTSWYFELAHEIAHMEGEHEHGPEHQSRFSSIFESRLESLSRLLE
ncbi:hypothetical protein FA15DRAFT_321762 [Coprinopsis marcescibilis]|uniref:WLM domain-containing protein n=1 Tax=Coprinopsis marcescibilis TaxID=230819 RepID=A0A5C3KBV0_COPMA|nr:hypothetical protein FA15DRAFT_321762 [Coprinopsis marcescibilis]